jgi:hypothetical protein
MGGLGNVMFQIATTEYNGHKYGFDTGYWNVRSQINVIEIGGQARLTHASEYLKMFKNFNWPSLTEPPGGFYNFKEIPFHYESFEVTDDTTYCSMFQSEQYFPDRNFILSLFKPNDHIIKKLQKYNYLLEGTSCAIHVRRGDYLKENGIHKAKSIDYYQKGINMIGPVDNWIIFSDDIEWCKKTFLDHSIFTLYAAYFSNYI